MHGPIRDRLEGLLSQNRLPPNLRSEDDPRDLAQQDTARQNALGGDSSAVLAHLAACAGCSSELDAMRRQASQLASLRVPEIEPSVGFYARVMQIIEEREAVSLCSFFAESSFSRRLAVASLTIALALGSYVVTQESRQQPLHSVNFFAWTGKPHLDAPVTGSQDERRDAVLENFASHQLIANRDPLSQGLVQ